MVPDERQSLPLYQDMVDLYIIFIFLYYITWNSELPPVPWWAPTNQEPATRQQHTENLGRGPGAVTNNITSNIFSLNTRLGM